ncbi:MAG: hypothetical protein ACLRV7_08440 [Hoylesella buccalis]
MMKQPSVESIPITFLNINDGQTGRHMEVRKFFIGQFDTIKPPHWRITIQRHTFWTS